MPMTKTEAKRLLTQCTYGPTPTTVAALMASDAQTWVDAQLAMPDVPYHTARWAATAAVVTPTADDVHSGIYNRALTAPDQLRQRVKLALSQIFVVSTALLSGERAEAVASFWDMLGRNAFGNFRTLLEEVALHPAMGVYLSSLANQPADVATGRQPDQNFAREIMQLFTIGLVKLNADGTPMLTADGIVNTYSQDDVAGLAAVFTGWSWSGPSLTKARFMGGLGQASEKDAARYRTPMQAYPQYHSKDEKKFLGITIPADANASAQDDLAIALDTLFFHPNVGPFIARQLIQRLITSNPSSGYVARVAGVFDDDGNGVRGNMAAVVRAVVLDMEARNAPPRGGTSYGKIKEPVLRITAWLRAFNATSDNGNYLLSATDGADTLMQTPARSPSVFNFWRPGFVPGGGPSEVSGLVLPEMQITSETSTAGYINSLVLWLNSGIGPRGIDNTGTRSDVQPDYSAEMAIAYDVPALVDAICDKLLTYRVSPGLRKTLVDCATLQTIPVQAGDGSNQATVDTRKKRRINTITVLIMASQEFLQQK